ncbi:hypothetical protein [Micromonospora sp. Llam0]|uniref:hypothetical protein n=1 Tax=Micromonospora sp. Llam0 TaxID=2485143 RepID=UPI000F47B846|nr:hypothetical protein [Micromonospora sp. Llam0]
MESAEPCLARYTSIGTPPDGARYNVDPTPNRPTPTVPPGHGHPRPLGPPSSARQIRAVLQLSGLWPAGYVHEADDGDGSTRPVRAPDGA